MEIEFLVRITQEEKRQQFYASLSLALAAFLSSLLIGLFTIPALFVFSGLLLAAWCFKPYLKILAQAKMPDRIGIENDTLFYFVKGKKVLSLPIRAIARTEYRGGLAVFLKRPITEKIEIFDPKILTIAKEKKCDFYFEWIERKILTAVQFE